MLFNLEGIPQGRVQKEHAQFFPHPGWVEHDPCEILNNVLSLLEELLSPSGRQTHNVIAVGLANQRETIVAWDRHTGQPLYPAIVWQDLRTEAWCRLHAPAYEERALRVKTGTPLSSYFSAPKIRWLMDHVPAVQEALASDRLCLGTMDSWILWHLTGGIHATDPTNASRTQLMNLATLEWDPELCQFFGVSPETLPQIRASSDDFGTGRGLLQGVPITGILGDQQAALLGQGGTAIGDLKNTYGTGCFLLAHAGNQIPLSRHGLITTVAFRHAQQPPHYALEGSIAMAGALIQWLRDNLGLIHQTDEIESLAKTVDDSGGVYLVPAFSGLFAPHWKSCARGTLIGLTGHTQRGHLARAALESTAFQTREIVEALSLDLGAPIQALRVDGGMTVNSTLMQFQADILGMEVITADIAETTARGAAFAAGLGSGHFPSPEDLKRLWRPGVTYLPKMLNKTRETRYQRWLQAINRSIGWETSGVA